jgi:thymidylate synthase
MVGKKIIVGVNTLAMRILVITNSDYGTRHLENIIRFGPSNWVINHWRAPVFFPLVIDYPEEFLPNELPSADLILSFAEHKAVAELIPDIARMTAAQAVIAAVDNENCLPRGLARQLRGWLEKMNVACATPKPLCSLTETDYWVTRRQRLEHHSPLIAEFAGYFGKPEFSIQIDPVRRTITSVEVKRDAVCGCARYVAQKLIGVSVDDAEYEAGMAHHHYPCLASMGIDIDFSDTLLHVSGNIMKENVGEQVKSFKQIQYLEPGIRSED